MISDPPLLTVWRTFPRPELALVDKLLGAQVGHVIDAMIGRGALDCAIKPVDPAVAAFAGIAFPVESFADDNLAILAALAYVKPGDVIVVAADGFSRSAVVGDNVAMMAKNAGVRAIVVDGMARDLDGLLGVKLPVHARGITPNSCVKSGPGKVGLPIVAGGVAIAAGDVVVGDADGVAVIPQGDLARVVGALDEIRRLEGELQAKIKAGLVCPDNIRALLASERVRFVE
jgi:4-hydroxy-4-methyl-2-oxoglutarate aldolase